MKTKIILLARKPATIAEIKNQVDGKFSPAEIVEVIGEKEIKEACYNSWNELQESDLSSSQFWKIRLVEEDEFLLIDTSGYNYPRYVGFIERRSDEVPLKEKLKDYREHYFVMMDDLSKDELIKQIWDSKPMAEKVKEANEFCKVFDA